MDTLFTKRYLKFAGGFMALIALGILGAVLAGVYDSLQSPSEATPPPSQEQIN